MKKSFILILFLIILSFSVYADLNRGSSCPGNCGCYDENYCINYDDCDSWYLGCDAEIGCEDGYGGYELDYGGECEDSTFCFEKNDNDIYVLGERNNNYDSGVCRGSIDSGVPISGNDEIASTGEPIIEYKKLIVFESGTSNPIEGVGVDFVIDGVVYSHRAFTNIDGYVVDAYSIDDVNFLTLYRYYGGNSNSTQIILSRSGYVSKTIFISDIVSTADPISRVGLYRQPQSGAIGSELEIAGAGEESTILVDSEGNPLRETETDSSVTPTHIEVRGEQNFFTEIWNEILRIFTAEPTESLIIIPFEYDNNGEIISVDNPVTYNFINNDDEIEQSNDFTSSNIIVPIGISKIELEIVGYSARSILVRDLGDTPNYVAMIKDDGKYENKLCNTDEPEDKCILDISTCKYSLCSQRINTLCDSDAIGSEGAIYGSCNKEFLCIRDPAEAGFCGEARNLNYEDDVVPFVPSEEINSVCFSDDDCYEGYECGDNTVKHETFLERLAGGISRLFRGDEPSGGLSDSIRTCKLVSTAEIIEGSMRFRIVETGVVADSIGGIPSPDLEADTGGLGDSSEKLITLFEYDSDGNKVNIDYPVNYKFWYNDIITHTTTELSSTDSNDGILSIPATTTYIQVTKEGYLPRNVLIRDIEGSYAYSVAMIKSHFKYQSKQCSFYDECVSGICSGWLCIQSRQPRECSGRIVKEEENAGYGSCGTEFLCFKKSVATPNIGFCGEAINLGYYEPTGSAPLSDIDTSESLGSAPRVWQLDFDVLCYLDSTKVDKCSINGIEYRETGIDTREFYKWVYWLFENEDGERCSSDLDPNAADTCMFGNKIYTETGIDSKIFLSSDNGDVCTLKPNEVDVCIINGVRYVELALNLDYNSAQFRSFQTCSNFLGMINNCTVNNVLYTQESEGNEYYNTADGWNSITLLFTEDVNALDTDGDGILDGDEDTDGVPDSSPGGDGTGGGSRDTCSQLRGCYATGGSTCQGGYIDNNAREANCCVPKKGDKEECGSDGECKSNICKNIHGDGECDGDAEVEYGCSRSEYNPLSGTTVNLLESECVDNDGDGLGKKTFKEAGEIIIIRQEDCTILPKSYKGKETSFYGILSLILSLGLIGIYYKKRIKF